MSGVLLKWPYYTVISLTALKLYIQGSLCATDKDREIKVKKRSILYQAVVVWAGRMCN
jgi:hypothetical protein